MSIQRLRRFALLAALALLSVLAGCGSGTIEGALKPTRIITFGDAFSDVGQTGAKFTVNDGSVNIWTQEAAALYGRSITPSSAGGLGYSVGNARVILKPDAAGSSATPTIKEQIDTFLASNTIGPNDLVMINGGLSDLIVQWNAVLSGAQSQAQMTVNLTQAANDLAAQVRRLTVAGATHVVLVGIYNGGRTPWGTSTGGGTVLNDAMNTFNNTLLLAVGDLGGSVLYVDIAYFYNLVTGNPKAYSLLDSTSIICASVDPANGIGIGVNQVNSRLCSLSFIPAGLNYNQYFFADGVYPTPQAHRLFGDYVYARVTQRW